MPSIKEKILENWVLKITAIFLALILWLFIQSDPGRVTTVAAKVYFDNIPDDMKITSDLPETVQVIIRGTSQSLSCTVDLKNAAEGENTISLTEDQIEASQGRRPEVISVNPSQIEIVLEKTIQKTVPITIPVQNDPAEGFEVYEKISIPDEVTILGPRTHVDAIEEVPTDIIDLSGRKEDESLGVNLNLKDHSIRPSFTGIVDVNIRIGPRRKMYVVKDVPISFGEGAPYLSSPKKVDIQIMAPEIFKQALVPDNFRLTIDDRLLQNATFPLKKVRPQIRWYPEDWEGKVKIIGTDPSEVEISRNEKASSKK